MFGFAKSNQQTPLQFTEDQIRQTEQLIQTLQKTLDQHKKRRDFLLNKQKNQNK